MGEKGKDRSEKGREPLPFSTPRPHPPFPIKNLLSPSPLGWPNTQARKQPAHSYLSPNLELPTPTESRHIMCILEAKSPSVKLMSRKQNYK